MSKVSKEPTENISTITDPPKSPKAVLSVSREEFYLNPLELIVQERQTEQEYPNDFPQNLLSDKCWKECQLPADLKGHVFIVGAVGYPGSPKHPNSDFVVEPASDGLNCIINGEGMIYRLDFHQTPQNTSPEPGKSWIATRIVKTPDYYADLALQQDGEHNKYKEKFSEIEYKLVQFNSFFITRLSIILGTRNLLNTAFLPMKFSNGEERLLVCWDNGRPYEVNPQTLGLVGPVGWNSQWHPLTNILEKLSHIFPIILSSAHPVFDIYTDEMFTVYATKNLNILWPWLRIFTFDAREFTKKYITAPRTKKIFDKLVMGFIQLWQFFIEAKETILDLLKYDNGNSVFINRWKGEGTDVEQLKVIQFNGKPIKIQQSLHQMGLSKDFILFSDSAFKLPLEDFLAGYKNLKDKLQFLSNKLRLFQKYLSYPQLPYTDIYIVSRDQIAKATHTKSTNADKKIPTIKALRIRVNPETAHFLVEYDNSNEMVMLHIAHTASSDPAEFLKENDISIYNKDNPQLTEELKARKGMFVSPMDVNRLSVWPINVKELRDRQGILSRMAEKVPLNNWLSNSKLIESQKNEAVFLSKEDTLKYLWAISMYAWRGFQPHQFTDIYWNCWGVWPELLSEFIYEMYNDNDGESSRIIPVKEMVDDVLKKGKPANLIRTHIDRSQFEATKLTVEDHYNFPAGSFGNSPQFVPRSGTDDPTDGYIVCILLHSDNLLSDKSEIWIFDAKNLHSGPRYRLSHPKLNIGVTIHTTWLSKLEAPPARLDYSVRKDYQEYVKAKKIPAIQTLFEEDVYPHFELSKKET
jgi:hypothetical protein